MSQADTLEYYKQLILDHNKNPRNYGSPESFTHSAEGFNPLCGDKIQLYLTIRDDEVESVRFESKACALCKASSSMLTESVHRKSVEQARRLQLGMKEMLSGTETELGELNVFSSVAKYPARAKCVMLPWNTLLNALQGEKN